MLRGGEATVQRSATAILLVMFLGNGALLSAQETLHPLSGFEEDSDGADVLGAIADSLKLLLIEHGSRITLQEKTRRELGGTSGATTNARSASPSSGRIRTLGG